MLATLSEPPERADRAQVTELSDAPFLTGINEREAHIASTFIKSLLFCGTISCPMAPTINGQRRSSEARSEGVSASHQQPASELPTT